MGLGFLPLVSGEIANGGSRMQQKVRYPVVTESLLAEIVQRILSSGDPLKIVLFGSRARGEGRPDSDLDLLVIEESDQPRYKRSARYRRALLGTFPAKDIVVWTPQEVEEWSLVPNAFITAALAEGRILYERQPGPGLGMDSQG